MHKRCCSCANVFLSRCMSVSVVYSYVRVFFLFPYENECRHEEEYMLTVRVGMYTLKTVYMFKQYMKEISMG